MTYIILLLLMLLLATLPWLTNQAFFCIKVSQPKSLFWHLLELIVYYAVFMALAFYAEHNTFGAIAPQAWEFYTTTGCLFLVASFPGFIYKRFWRGI